MDSSFPIRLSFIIRFITKNVVHTHWKMVCDGVLDNLDELDTGIRCSDAVLVEKLDHKPSEPLESSGDTGGRVDLNENVLRSSDENLEKSSSVERRVKQHQQALVGDVRPGGREVAIVPGEDPLVLVNVEKRELLPSLARLQVCSLQDNN